MEGHRNGVPVPALALLRQWAGLSQHELAERAGVGRNTISRLENGANARFDTIDKLAKALGTGRTRLIHPPRHLKKEKHQQGSEGRKGRSERKNGQR